MSIRGYIAEIRILGTKQKRDRPQNGRCRTHLLQSRAHLCVGDRIGGDHALVDHLLGGVGLVDPLYKTLCNVASLDA
jgi:hypothetical protein